MSYERLDKDGLSHYSGKIKNKIDEISGTTLTGTLTAGSTSLTLSNAAVKTTSLIDVYTDVWGVAPTNVSVATGSVTFKKNDVAIATATISNQGTCSFTVMEQGTYEVSASGSGQTFTAEVSVIAEVTAELKGFTWQDWLATADISPYGYSSLDDVLADEVAIRKLMTIHDSVDYLVDSLV